jgi:hypothetical protein
MGVRPLPHMSHSHCENAAVATSGTPSASTCMFRSRSCIPSSPRSADSPKDTCRRRPRWSARRKGRRIPSAVRRCSRILCRRPCTLRPRSIRPDSSRHTPTCQPCTMCCCLPRPPGRPPAAFRPNRHLRLPLRTSGHLSTGNQRRTGELHRCRSSLMRPCRLPHRLRRRRSQIRQWMIPLARLPACLPRARSRWA